MEQTTDIEQLQEDEKLVMDYLGYYKDEFIKKCGQLHIDTRYGRDDFKRYTITLGDAYDLGNFLKRVTSYRLHQEQLINTESKGNYIFYRPVLSKLLSCSHINVKQIWEWGGLSATNDSIMNHYITIILNDNSRHDFKGNEDESAFEKANKFLEELNVTN